MLLQPIRSISWNFQRTRQIGCSHVTAVFFWPFKTAYRKACGDLMSTFPGTLVSRATFCGLLNKAWTDAVTSTNITSGFRACGIQPHNPDAVPQEAYIPSTLYSSTNTGCSDEPNAENQQSGLSEPELVTSLSPSASSLSSVHNSTPVNVTSLPTAAPFQAPSGLSE